MNSESVHANKSRYTHSACKPIADNCHHRSVWSVGFGVKDLPIVMQAVFIIQLQIVPDKVLLGNRDTFMDSQKLGEKTNEVNLNILVFQCSKLTNMADKQDGEWQQQQ